jgi:dolichol-phosphate mannosyltransferase
MTTSTLSLIVPAYNEAGNLLPLLEQAMGVLNPLAQDFEIIVVNDGSTDATAAELTVATMRWPQCRELRLPRNQGQAIALLTGLRAARGEILLTMDADGQNDPRDFPALLALVESGRFDFVCGRRVDRHDTALRRVMSVLANGLRRGILDDGIHDAGCQLRVFRRELVTALEPMELLQSFLPSLAVAAGLRVAEVRVHHHPRTRGNSKYGFGRLWWRPAIAMLALRWRLWSGYRPRVRP